MALPASLPRNQAANNASAFSASQGMTSGRPENRTTTTRKPFCMRSLKHGLRERALQWRHFGECPARRLTAHVGLLANAQHDSIRVVAQIHGRGNTGLIPAR